MCYFKQTDPLQTNGTTTGVPLLRGGLWYHVRQGGSDFTSGSRSPFYQQSTPKTIVTTCPQCNFTSVCKPGESFDVDVSVYDANGNLYYGQVELQAFTNFQFTNSLGYCPASVSTTYDYAASGKTQLSTPITRYRITPISGCNGGACSVSFTSSGLTTSSTCTFRMRSVGTRRLTVTQAPAQCALGSRCTFTVTATTYDGNVDYSSDAEVSVIIPEYAGVAFSTLDNSLRRFIGGVYTFSLQIDVNLFTIANWVNNHNVAILFSSQGFTASAFVTVARPTLSKVFIKDIIAVSPFGGSLNDVKSNAIPKWEPTLSHASLGYWKPAQVVSSVSGAGGSYLVAGQYYKVTLQTVDANGNPLPSADLIGLKDPITMPTPHPSNVVIGPQTGSVTNVHYETPIGLYYFNNVEQSLVFRMKNSRGCSYSVGGCKLSFLFGGRDFNGPTYLETYVRSVATALRVSCSVGGGSTYTTVCPRTSVEIGYNVKLEAVDQFGDVDEYFSGTATMFLDDPTGMASATNISSLIQGGVDAPSGGMITADFVNGVAFVYNLTATRPCVTDCKFVVGTTWGTGTAFIAVGIDPSTTQLRCSVASSLYSLSGDTVTSTYISNSDYLIYSDTTLCLNAFAANATGGITYYETLWITYQLYSTSRTSGNVFTRDVIASSRVKPLKNSQVQFCFTVGGTEGSTFGVQFVVQRFKPPHWSASSGSCKLESFTLRTKKYPATLAFASVQGLTGDVAGKTGTNYLWQYTQLPSVDTTTTSITIDFIVLDHYGNEVKEIATSLASAYVSPGQCWWDNLKTGTVAPCNESSSSATVAGALQIFPYWNVAEGGMLTVGLTQQQPLLISSTRASFKMYVLRFCVKCTLKFSIRTGGTTDIAYNSITASLDLSILLPKSGLNRYVAFKYLSSPLAATVSSTLYTSSPWQFHAFTSTVPTAFSLPTGKTSIIHSKCFETTACLPSSAEFLTPVCGSSSSSPPDTISNNGQPIEVYVVATLPTTSNPLINGSPQCGGSSSGNCGAATVSTQIDFWSGYDLSITIGSQQLRCLGADCVSDGYPSTVRLSASGDTIVNALQKLTVNPPTSKFMLQGLSPSTYYGPSVTTTKGPNVRGPLIITATTNYSTDTITSLSTQGMLSGSVQGDYVFAWASTLPVATFKVSDVTLDSECLGASSQQWLYTPMSSALYTGYKQLVNLTTLAASYANTTFAVGVSFPITVVITDAAGNPVIGASAPVTASLIPRSDGCGNGGNVVFQPSSTVSLINGKATFYVSFSATCERCILQFTIVPPDDDVFKSFKAQQAFHTILSKPITVRSMAKISSTSSTVICTDTPSNTGASTNVDAAININLGVMTSLGALATIDTTSQGTAMLYNYIQNIPNTFFVGNGGYLRSATAVGANTNRYAVTKSIFSGYSSLSFSFQRVCEACRVIVVWSLTSGQSGSFILRNSQGTNFRVAGVPVRRVFPGYSNAILRMNTWSAVPMLHVADGNGIPNIGVALTSRDPAVPDQVVQDSSNGDGGSITMKSIFLPNKRAEVWFVKYTAPCAECRLVSSDDYVAMVILTTATTLKITSMSPYFVAPDAPITLSLAAVDDNGYTDQSIGGPSQCNKYYVPFSCTVPTVRLDVALLSSLPLQDNSFSVGGRSGQAKFVDSSSAVLIDGKITDVKFSISEPSLQTRPIFTALGTTPLLATTAAAVRPIDVTVGVVGLAVRTDQTRYSLFKGQSASIYIGLVKVYKDSGISYIAVEVNTSVTIKINGCGDSVSVIPMVRGLAYYTGVFSTVTTGGPSCKGFIDVQVNGYICVQCSAAFEVEVKAVTANKWTWVRPTKVENGISNIAGPRNAVANRKQYLAIQLQMDVAGSPTLNTTACIGCRVVIKTSSCNVKPALDPAEAYFDEFGVARITAFWPTASESYSCSLETSVMGGLESVSGPSGLGDGTAGALPSVAVCIPYRLFVVTNESSYQTSEPYLRTGRVFNFTVEIRNAQGVVCNGDSQEDGTAITVLSVGQNDVPSVVRVIGAFGSSLTQTAVGGRVTFQVQFTDSTWNLGLGGIRLKFTSAQTLTIGTVYTGVFATHVGANTLRIFPNTPLPTAWVTGRPMPTTFGFLVQATDGLPVGATSTSPNIPTKPSEFGSTALVEWAVEPPLAGGYPLVFSSGKRQINLEKGEKLFAFTYAGTDGLMFLQVRHVGGIIAPTQKFPILFQTPRYIAFGSCISSCDLPSPFSKPKTTYMNITTGTTFTITVQIVDSNFAPVRGENSSVIGLRVVKSATGSADLQIPSPSVKLTGGVGLFTVTFVGTTLKGSESPTDLVTIEAYCISLECQSFVKVATLPIAVTTAFGTDGAADRKRPVVRIPTTLSSLALLDTAGLRDNVRRTLATTSTFVTADNAKSIIGITACEVLPSIYDSQKGLGDVCTKEICGTIRDATCPRGIVLCKCDTALKHRDRFHNLQNVAVTIEVGFSVKAVPSLEGADDTTIQDVYQRMTATFVTGLTSDPTYTTYKVNTTGLQVSYVTSAPTPAPGVPGPGSATTLTPGTVSPGGTTPSPASSTGTPSPPLVPVPTPARSGAFRLNDLPHLVAFALVMLSFFL